MIDQEKLLEKVTANSGPWWQELQKLAGEFPQHLLGVRGRGYMIGLQMAGDPAPYQLAMREAGLLAPTSGGHGIRLLPPLVATPAELDRSVEIIRGVLRAKS